MIQLSRRESLNSPTRIVHHVGSFQELVPVLSGSMDSRKAKTEYPLYSAEVDGSRDFLMLDIDTPTRETLKGSRLTRITYPSHTKGNHHMLLDLSRPVLASEWSAFKTAFSEKYSVPPHKGELFEPSKGPITVYIGEALDVDSLLASNKLAPSSRDNDIEKWLLGMGGTLLLEWLDNPYGSLYLWGPGRVGKTLLGRALERRGFVVQDEVGDRQKTQMFGVHLGNLPPCAGYGTTIEAKFSDLGFVSDSTILRIDEYLSRKPLQFLGQVLVYSEIDEPGSLHTSYWSCTTENGCYEVFERIMKHKSPQYEARLVMREGVVLSSSEATMQKTLASLASRMKTKGIASSFKWTAFE